MLRIVVGIILAAPWLVHPSRAQEPPAPEWKYTAEVFGNIAHGRFYHGDHVWGSGLDYGGGFGVRPFPGKLHRLGFEVQLARLKKSGAKGPYPAENLDSRLIMANAVYHFRNGAKTQPYVFGGLGLVKVDYYRRCVTCVFDVDPVTGEWIPRVTEDIMSGSKVGVTFGAGLKIALHRRLSIRPELLFVDTTPGSGWNWAWVRLQIGVGAHF
jgi:opacity protein-like surface antigen